MSVPLLEIRDDLLKLAMKVEDLRQKERSGSTADVLERFALDLGHNFELIEDELRELQRASKEMAG